MKDGFLGAEVEDFTKWFNRLYPQHKLTVHYKWQKPEHKYYFEIKRGEGDTKILPLVVPDAWFEDPTMEALLRNNFHQKMQQKTIRELG